jgi:hypothetical protein
MPARLKDLFAQCKTPHNPVKSRTQGVEIGVWHDEDHVQDEIVFALQGHKADALWLFSRMAEFPSSSTRDC